MDKANFYKYALTKVPKGKHIVAIDFLAFQNKYVAVLANEGQVYPFTGKIYEPDLK